MNRNIILCGFMGSGKSTVGRLLAKRLLTPFIDLDALIEQEQNMSIPEIFEQKGEAFFRELEHTTLKKALEHNGPQLFNVIASGGGTFMNEKNAALLREHDALVIYLSTDFDICYERIRNSDRPLVRKNSREQLHALYNERNKVYSSICTMQMYNHAQPSAVVNNIISVVNPLSIQKL